MAAQAEGFIAQGRLREAEAAFRELIGQTHVIDYEYDDWLRRLAELYVQLERPKEAGYVYLYLHYFDLARNRFPGEDGLAERARVCEVEKRWEAAAELYAEAHRFVHAAVALEKAGKHAEAATIWGNLVSDPRLREHPYQQALVHFNYGMALQVSDPDSVAGRRALIDSQRYLEQVADDFETAGERERAFDCYQILLKLGRDSDQFENLAEGYLNSIRVLKDDGLKFYVLQYYEDFISLALERGELHAASTLYQEAGDYSTRNGLPYDRNYQTKAAGSWAACGEQYLKDDAPVEMAENAFLAAISCYSSVGDYTQVRALFSRLSKIDLPEKKTQRYGKIASRYESVAMASEEAPEFPDYLKQQHAYADIWFVDLLEWELGGRPQQVAMSIVGDLRYPDAIRRRALVVMLTMADAATRSEETGTQTLETVTELLGELQSYAALCPLEMLYKHQEPLVRRAAVRALRFLFFKRSFTLIRQALEDVDQSVRTAAVEALRGLHFPHAFNPLTRIYRESDEPLVRAVALESVGKIQSIEAGEFLLSVLRQEDGDLRDAAIQALSALDNADVLPIMRQYHQIETNPQVRTILEQLLQQARHS
jgi:tetratricopeptide (TPR) repeat protein